LAYFDPNIGTDPFIVLKGIPEQPLSPRVVTYSLSTSQFIFITHGETFSIGQNGENTVTLRGLPDYAFKTLSLLGQV